MTGLGALFLHGVRERLSNYNRLLICGGLFLIPVVMMFFDKGADTLPDSSFAFLMALVMGSGLIGTDAASGVLQLVLARPVTRAAYVVGRWLAAAALVGGIALLQTLLVAISMAVHGHWPGWPPLLLAVTAQASIALGIPAVLIAFSAWMPGLGDMRVWVLGWLLGAVVHLVGQAKELPWLNRSGTEIQQFLYPRLEPEALADLLVAPWNPLVAWASTVAISLAVAIVVLNRKELSYGAS